MTSFFGILTILSAVFAVGAIEDCDGACMGNENWTAFFICLTFMITCGIMTILTMNKKGQ